MKMSNSIFEKEVPEKDLLKGSQWLLLAHNSSDGEMGR